jgi:hypothetical protein
MMDTRALAEGQGIQLIMPKCNFAAIPLWHEALLTQYLIFTGNSAQRHIELASSAFKVGPAELAFHRTCLHPNTLKCIVGRSGMLTGCDHRIDSS